MSRQAISSAIGLGLIAREAVRAGLDPLVGHADIPLGVDAVDARWLSGALGLSPDSITSVSVLDQDSGTAARARIAVKSDVELPETMFVKLPPRNYIQRVLMNVFRLGTREILAYRALGDAPPVRVPKCYVAQSDQRRQRSVLVLEDLSHTADFRTCVDSVSGAEAEAVVDAFADLHAAYWRSERFDDDLAPLARRTSTETHTADLIRRRFIADITGHAADLIPAETKRRARIFFERSKQIDAFWAAQPQTLIHGDPHLGNLFFEADGPGLLDWQIASAGVGIRDVAYFATASTEPDLLRRIERDLVERYADRLQLAGIDVDPAEQWTLYRAAITEVVLAAVCTAEAGERMQPKEISRVGVERAVAGVEAHDSFGVLEKMIGG